jgi:predicted Zn-dependent peptidase
MNVSKALSALTAVIALPLHLPAQDYTHPRQMNLPAPGFTRPDPHRYQVQLPNGLVAYVVEDRRVPLVTITAFVRAGTADAKPGVAQTLERALRSGPANTTAADFQQALVQMTAEYRVTTGRELTEVSLNVPAADAWQALDLLAALLREPRITAPDPTAFRSVVDVPADRAVGESGPVLYEGSMPVAVALFEDLLYGDHPYGARVSEAAVRMLTESDVRDFHRRYFVPGNVVVALGGDFDAAEARRRVEQAFAGWPRGRPPTPAALPPLPPMRGQGGERVVHTFDADKLQGWVVLGHELPAVPLEDEAAVYVMNYILAGDHLAGRMFLEARDRRGLANDEIGHPEPNLRGPGTYTFRAAGRPESIPQLIDIALREIAKIQAEPVMEEELFVAKGALADGEFAYRFRNGHAISVTFAREWASDRDHRRSATYADRVRSVTAADVQAAARRYLHPEQMQIVLVGPLAQIREAALRGGHPALDRFGRVVEGR